MSVQTGAAVVGAVAVAYGLGYALLPLHQWNEAGRSWYTRGGAGLVALLLFALVLTPWFILRE